MSTLMLVNPKRRTRHHRYRRNPESRAKRSRAAKAGWRHRRSHRRMRRNPESHRTRVSAARRGWSHRRMHHNPRRRHYRRNPRRSMTGIMRGTLVPATVGASGAVLLNLALGYLPVPAALQTGWGKPLVGIAGALGLGWAAGKVAGRQAGERVALGAITVVMYGVINMALKTVAPNLPLSGYPRVGWVNPGMPVGMYVGTPQGRTVQPVQNPQMGMYVGVPGY